MGYVFILVIVSVIGFVCYKMFKGKSAPSNRFTPFDDITMGNKNEVKRDEPIQDTKHRVEYEERKNSK